MRYNEQVTEIKRLGPVVQLLMTVSLALPAHLVSVSVGTVSRRWKRQLAEKFFDEDGRKEKRDDFGKVF